MKKVYSYTLKCLSCGLAHDVYYGESTHITEGEFTKYMEQTASVLRQKVCPHCKTDSHHKKVSYTVAFKD